MELDKPSWATRSTLVKNHDENKTYILVKLSESFSNAIQEYSAVQNNNINHRPHHQQKYNNNIKSKHHNHQYNNNHNNNHNNHLINNNSNTTTTTTREPTIKFHGTRGAIKFPDGKCYDFSLEQSDNSVECIRQTKTRWETVGKMNYCLQVKGKDDVYQMTRTKLKAAEQEKRKYCAKLLGSPEHNNSISNNNKKTKLLNSNPTPIINSKPQQPAPKQQPAPLKTPSSNHNTTQLSSQKQQQPQPQQPQPQTNHHKHHKHQKHHDPQQHSQQQHQQIQPPPSSVTTNSNSKNNNNNINVNSNSALPAAQPAGLSAPQNKYPDIVDVKQLIKYKAEFDKDFQEYQNLHGYLQRIEERFRRLRELLKQSVEGSSEWESAKEQIFNEYERVKSDSNFHIARREYKQLRNKLSHIKEKIFQFKQRKKTSDTPVLKQQQLQQPQRSRHHDGNSKKKHKHQQHQLQQQRLQK